MTAIALHPSKIHILNWNIAKGRRLGWHQDLSQLALDKDLILIQEALLEQQMHAIMGERSCWAFAEGFTRPNRTTGVMTISRAKTLRHDKFSHREPLTGLPKAALVTEYRLLDHPHNLAVANVHAINFTAGTRHFGEQLRTIYTRLHNHQGPIIFCGDFNTWRRKRLQIVDGLITALDLKPVYFENDTRKLAFGMALDHIFVRGLNHRQATVDHVSSSDHNPMSAFLHL